MDVKDVVATVSATNVTITTTTEAIAVTSDPLAADPRPATVLVIGWAQATTGAGTTTVRPLIRRGTAITDDNINESNVETIKVTAGGTEVFMSMGIDTPAVDTTPRYSFTLTQADASGNGTILQGGIIAFRLQ